MRGTACPSRTVNPGQKEAAVGRPIAQWALSSQSFVLAPHAVLILDCSRLLGASRFVVTTMTLWRRVPPGPHHGPLHPAGSQKGSLSRFCLGSYLGCSAPLCGWISESAVGVYGVLLGLWRSLHWPCVSLGTALGLAFLDFSNVLQVPGGRSCHVDLEYGIVSYGGQ